jgi:hydroxymethylpyrimidine/phosphomethylpyrimidine kinase
MIALMKRLKQPVALTIAGSDSGGGAGIQADLKTFASLGVHGTCAITCLTAQNPAGVLGIQASEPDMTRLQLEAIFAELPPAAIKTGMLFSTAIIRVVVEYLDGRRQPLIVDPGMIATSGARLLKPEAAEVLAGELLPLATLVTPNLPEAEVLLEHSITSLAELRTAAQEIHRKFGCAALVKGGHLAQMREAVDFYFDGETELLLKAPFIKGISAHGTGCTYAAAIAGYCALGHQLAAAVELAKNYITQAIAQGVKVRGHTVLNHFWAHGSK